MAKTAQKKKTHKKLSRQKIFLLIVGLLIILLGVFVSVKIYEKNKALEDKKDLLDRSLEAVRNVTDKFYGQIQESKQKDTPARGYCSSAGKYSSLYTCGPQAQITVNDLDEAKFRSLNAAAIEVYEQSEDFDQVGSTQPRETSLDPGLTGSAGALLSGSDMLCYYSSNYIPDKKTATFAWGCNLRINDKYYPTSY